MRSVLVLAAFGTSGCAVVCAEGTHEVDGTCVLDLTDAASLQEVCRGQDPEILVLDVEFPALEAPCPWAEGDNLEAEQGLVTARVEQEVTLSLPQGVLCDLEFDFATSGGDVQQLQYKDHLFLTLDGVILSATAGGLVAPMPVEDGFPIYGWAPLAGMDMPRWDSHFCLGQTEEGGSWCDFPPTEYAGRMVLDLDQPTVASLAWRLLDSDSASMSFVVAGDDDEDEDCAHEALTFQVLVAWLPVE